MCVCMFVCFFLLFLFFYGIICIPSLKLRLMVSDKKKENLFLIFQWKIDSMIWKAMALLIVIIISAVVAVFWSLISICIFSHFNFLFLICHDKFSSSRLIYFGAVLIRGHIWLWTRIFLWNKHFFLITGANYSRFLPPNSYIDARKYHPKELAALLLKLTQDPVAYGKYVLLVILWGFSLVLASSQEGDIIWLLCCGIPQKSLCTRHLTTEQTSPSTSWLAYSW